MRFSIFIPIVHSPKTKTYLKNEKNLGKKSIKIVFPKLVTLVYFQKGLNPQIVENKEIHSHRYKNRRVKLL